MFTKRSNRSTRHKNQPHTRPLRVEGLEDRRLMIASAGGLGVEFEIPDWWSPPDKIGDEIANAYDVSLPALTQRAFTDYLPSSDDVDVFMLTLQEGDLLVADVDRASNVAPASRMSLLDANGYALASNITWGTEPETGRLSVDPSLGYWVQETGTYYLQLETTASDVNVDRAYNLKLERIALDHRAAYAPRLNTAGAFHAWLNEPQDRLIVTGPTGHGFSLEADWQKSRVGGQVDYSAQGTILLHTPALDSSTGAIALQVPPGEQFTVTAIAPGWDQLGEIAKVTGELGFSLTPFTDHLADTVGWVVDGVSLPPKWTIKWGSQIEADYPQHNIGQVLDGVPYLVYGAPGDLVASLGKTQIVAGDTGDLILIADPADPFLYLGYKDYAIAASLNGLIPFNNEVGPSHSGPFDHLPHQAYFGHVYASAEHQIKLNRLPLPFTLLGDMTVNLDANGDGEFLGGIGTAHQLLAGELDAVGNLYGDTQFSLNGGIDASFDVGKGKFTLSMPVVEASVLYSGTDDAVWFQGAQGPAAIDPWEGTPLEYLSCGPGVEIDGYVYGDGPFRVTVSGSQSVFGQEADLTVTVLSDGTVQGTQIRADGTVETVIGQATVGGAIQLNGDFQLHGSMNIDLGDGENFIRGGASAVLTRVGSEMKINADVGANAQFVLRDAWGNAYAKAEGSASGSLEMTVDANGQTHFNADLRYSVAVYYWHPFLGGWRKLGSKQGKFAVGNDTLSFDAFGYDFSVPLP